MNGYLKRNITQVKNEKNKENIMKQKMLDALRLRYEADYKQSKLTLDIYFDICLCRKKQNNEYNKKMDI